MGLLTSIDGSSVGDAIDDGRSLGANNIAGAL